MGLFKKLLGKITKVEETVIQNEKVDTSESDYHLPRTKEEYVDVADDNGQTALFISSLNGEKDVVKTLIAKGADINKQANNGATPLIVASQEGYFDIAQLLIDKNAKIDLHMNNGVTALFLASQEGHIEIAELLIKNDANLNISVTGGFTPLTIACQYGHNEMARMLIENGANLDVQFQGGYTPLSMATTNGFIDLAMLLVKEGAGLDFQTDEGETALYLASYGGYVELVKLLIEKGANLNLVAADRSSALTVATQERHTKIVEMLKKVTSFSLKGEKSVESQDARLLIDCVDELVSIGLTSEGFMSAKAGGAYDNKCRNIRAREIGFTIAEIAKRGTINDDNNNPIESTTFLMSIVYNKVAEKIGHSGYSSLKYAWNEIEGWMP